MSEERFRWGREAAAPTEGEVARLRDALRSDRRLSGWKLERTLSRSHQVYLAKTNVEALRRGYTEAVAATIYVTSGDMLGSAEIQLRPGEADLVSQKIDEALVVARTAEVRPYPLAPQTELPVVEIEDPEITRTPERALENAHELLVSLADAERDLRLASAEIYVSHETISFENSEGLRADRSGTRVTAEVVVIGLGPNQSEAEIQGLLYRRRLPDLELSDWIPRLSTEARDATRARPPSLTGIPVVIGAEAVPSFVGPLQLQTSATSSFQGTTTWELGDPIFEGERRGDGLTLYHDALLPYGNQSAPCDSDGVSAQRAMLIENGTLRRRWADLRYAHYTNAPATGQFANWTIDGGSQPASALLRGPAVLEVRQFSWLNPSPATGDFAAEVRFGYLHQNGQKVPIKGGTVAGNVFQAFADCQISRETSFVGNGLVPAAIRFHDLSTIGV